MLRLHSRSPFGSGGQILCFRLLRHQRRRHHQCRYSNLGNHFSIYERIRQKHPDALILLHDKPGCDYEPYPEREKIIFSTYEEALRLGDKRVCYICARELLGEKDRDCCMADTAHPTDLGAMRMADAIYAAIRDMIY